MDHASAEIIAFSEEAKTIRVISSGFTLQDEHETRQRSESGMHNKQQQRAHAYFEQIAAALVPYSKVVLFGPTEAKAAFYNLLRTDAHFDAIAIELVNGDYTTQPQKEAFVRDYFKRS